ncbi:glucosylglycerol 3-phosphatase [Pseudomonas segetis]
MLDYQTGYSLDSTELLNSLATTERLLIVQDLDGVCMGLVRDPLTRVIERDYIEAAARLAGRFYVLTNGEHIGRRGVNSLVEKSVGDAAQARERGLYLPGLAAGGVQFQDRFARVSHPGISEAELRFLQQVPVRSESFLRSLLASSPYGLDDRLISELVASAVLDNRVSPTLNINVLYQHFNAQPDIYRQLQQDIAAFMTSLHGQAAKQGLGASFFTHYAPNSGRDATGHERLKLGADNHAGTTDFQFMLSGAVKEVGLLVLLNHYYFAQTASYPLGEDFNARQAPGTQTELLTLALDKFDPQLMPRIVGVGDTVSSIAQPGSQAFSRGGSDRGFLHLVQALGEAFASDNKVVYIDSSAGEVRRPGVDVEFLQRRIAEPDLAPWPALQGISDPADPLRLDVIFGSGHQQYVEFFCELAERLDRTA